MAKAMKITEFLDVTPCSLVYVFRHFGGTSCLHVHGGRVKTEGRRLPRQVVEFVPHYRPSHIRTR
jgi:hypothetical protein